MTFSKLCLALVAVGIASIHAFTVTPNVSSSKANTVLSMSTSTPPPPTPPPTEQVKISSSSSTIAPSTSTTNLPSQKELANKASDVKVPPPKSSTNVVSGAGITITDIRYDGNVPKTESDEFVVITNKSKEPVDVSGYYIYVATSGTQGPTFYFPKGSVIKVNQSVRIYTNEIHPETGGYSYGSGKAIWSNNGGLAVLKDAKGKKLGEYKYKPSS